MNRFAISRSILVRVVSVVAGAVMLFSASCGLTTDPDAEVVTVGALVPLTGGQSALGEAVEASLLLAADIVNADLADVESPWRVALRIEDTNSDPEQAFEKLRMMSEDGIRVVVGPFDDHRNLGLGQSSSRRIINVGDEKAFNPFPNADDAHVW